MTAKSEQQEKRNFKVKMLKKQNIFAVFSMIVVCLGALGVGACLVLSEILYPKIESLFDCPAGYQAALYVSVFVAVIGIVGCAFSKNSQNTKRLEWKVNLALFLLGLVCEIVCALARDNSYVLDVLICIGGAVSSVGFFCGIGSLIGRLKKPKGEFASVYKNLIVGGNLDRRHFPKAMPAQISEIEKVEAFLGCSLPNELVDFFLEFDGDGELLFSASEIIDATKRVRAAHKGANEFCFFGGDRSENYFCYKILNGNISGKEIFFFDHQTGKTRCVAHGMTELIKKYYTGKID